MKDFYDLWVLARDFEFHGETLAMAIRNTFARRRTKLPEGTPSGLGPAFAGDRQKTIQWKAFLSKLSAGGDGPTLPEVCQCLDTFLKPPTEAARHAVRFPMTWHKDGQWSNAV